ncbi:formate dehydrogenase accessory protein FdhE [Paracoccus luteus]|uniref:formate dehydrogenase accessory protein FdhE n=1 Tax=Paracoccus luteus TaxID=2508543 RepID=UPI00106F92EA|nr:formate dehydrogenase accessory protein FdhE [Paracoccus luteus]
MTQDIPARPDMIGGVSTPPLAILPRPARLFAARADRFAHLADGSRLAPYLRFMADLTRAQARLADTLPPATAPDPDRVALARAARMPPIDRHAVLDDAALAATLDAVIAAARDIDMPAPARLALDALADAAPEDRRWLIANILDDAIPADSVAPHLFVAAAVQLHLARLAAGLDAGQLVAIRTGVCPCCGGKPAASVVTGVMGAEGARYAACAGCQTLWNEVRVKCLSCGSTKGIGFQSLDDGTGDAQVKAETCDECDAWVKQMDQHKNPSLDPIADDVASLGLDALMQGGRWRRGGFDPFLTGY